MAIKKVGVLGCGLMGSGIAQVAAQAGYDTVVREVEQKFVDKGLAGIEKNLGRSVEKGKLKGEEKDACLSRLKGTVSLDESFRSETNPRRMTWGRSLPERSTAGAYRTNIGVCSSFIPGFHPSHRIAPDFSEGLTWQSRKSASSAAA